jgi:hypothetical protein
MPSLRQVHSHIREGREITLITSLAGFGCSSRASGEERLTFHRLKAFAQQFLTGSMVYWLPVHRLPHGAGSWIISSLDQNHTSFWVGGREQRFLTKNLQPGCFDGSPNPQQGGVPPHTPVQLRVGYMGRLMVCAANNVYCHTVTLVVAAELY